jgi:Spy/CpxP family protein refolding chaperone
MGAKIRSFPMTTKSISITAAALLAVTLGVGAALAQSNPAPSSHAPMMQGGADKPSMMDMSKMNRMMDNCNQMMESMQQHPRSEPGTTALPDKG